MFNSDVWDPFVLDPFGNTALRASKEFRGGVLPPEALDDIGDRAGCIGHDDADDTGDRPWRSIGKSVPMITMARTRKRTTVSDENPIKPAWAVRLGEARRRAGLTQESLAEAIGYSQSSVADYERGKSEPDLALMERIAGLCSVSPGWLAFGIGEPAKDDPLAFSVLERHKHDKLFSFAFTQAARLFSEEGLAMDLAYLATYTLNLLRKADGLDRQSGTQERITAALDAERLKIRAELDEFRKNHL